MVEPRRRRERTPTYQSWRAMKERCTRSGHPAWGRYGGRGIAICERWTAPREGFANFLADMGERPEGLTLDRIDNDGDYEPANCRWATLKQQQRDKPRLTHCKRGHAMEGDNVYVRPDTGKRMCKACCALRKRP